MEHRVITQGSRLVQLEAAERMMYEYVDYARQIGCTVGEGAMRDCIEINTPGQSVLLSAKWEELTQGRKG